MAASVTASSQHPRENERAERNKTFSGDGSLVGGAGEGPGAARDFELLGLDRDILRGVYSHGFHRPSQIQHALIPVLLRRRDAVIQSKNGTGKTATFLLAMLQLLNRTVHKTQAIVLSPTRDLAVQTFSVFESLSKFTEIKGHCSIGGHGFNADLNALREGAQVLCGTPGRVLQLLSDARGMFADVGFVVFDEADRILDSGFKNQVKNIFTALAKKSPQFVLISATLPQEILELLNTLLKNPHMHLLPQSSLSLTQIEQCYIEVKSEEEKIETVYAVFSEITVSQAVIFANKREAAVQLERSLSTQGFSVVCLHSGLPQEQRGRNMSEFLAGKHRILVATDVAARGIDAAYVNLVINYDIPLTGEEYLHRIGRGGRFGKSAMAVSIVLGKEVHRLLAISQRHGAKMQCRRVKTLGM